MSLRLIWYWKAHLRALRAIVQGVDRGSKDALRFGYRFGHSQLHQVLRVDEFGLIGEFVVEVGHRKLRLAVEQLLLHSAVIGARVFCQEGMNVILRDQLRAVGNHRRIAQQVIERIVLVVDAGLFNAFGEVEGQPRSAEHAATAGPHQIIGQRSARRAGHAEYRVVLDSAA